MDDEFVFLSSSGCFDGDSSGSGSSSGSNGGCGMMVLGMGIMALLFWVLSMVVDLFFIKCTQPDTKKVDSTESFSDKIRRNLDTIKVLPCVDSLVKPEPQPESGRVSSGTSRSYGVEDDDEYDDEEYDEDEYDEDEQEDREYDDYDDDEVD